MRIVPPLHADTNQISLRVEGPSAELAAIPGRQMERMGQEMTNLGTAMLDQLTREREEENTLRAREVDARAMDAYNGLLHDPDNGLLNRRGKAAVDGFDPGVNSLKSLHQQLLDGIGDPGVVARVQPLLMQRRDAAIDNLRRHTAKEKTNFALSVSDARIDAAIRSGASNYSDPYSIYNTGNVLREEVEAQGALLGWNDEVKAAKFSHYRDHAMKAQFEAQQLDDPVEGLRSFLAVGTDLLSPDVRLHVGNQLFSAAAPFLADRLANSYSKMNLVANPDGTLGTLSRGLRNNNPGNITQGSDKWEGQVAGSDPKFATFESVEAGVRAMGRTLLTYQDKHGLRTIEDIANRWAPAHENNAQVYTDALSKSSGFKPDEAVDLHDPAVLARITRGIILVENGKTNAAKVTDAQISTGLDAALNNTPLSAKGPTFKTIYDDPTIPTMDTLVDALPYAWKERVVGMAKARAHQQQAALREDLRDRVTDAKAAFMSQGYAPSPPALKDFVAAYGQAEGQNRWRDFQGVAILGQRLQEVRTLPAPALANLLETSKPVPGDGFAERQHNYEILAKTVDMVHKARQEDPIGYALNNGGYAIRPITSGGDPQESLQELGRRAAAAPQIAADYGTAPALLSKAESKALAANIKAAPVEQQKQYLSALYNGIRDMGPYKQLMQQLTPDAPVVAVAGIYQARGLKTTQSQDVADLILRGQAILAPNRKEDGNNHQGGQSIIKMPPEKDLLTFWNSETGEAFRGRERANDLFMQTARAIYAARSAEEGDYSGELHARRWKSAIALATGGIVAHNGARVVAPYGLGYDQFQEALKGEIGRLSAAGTLTATPAEMMRLPLESAGDGRYFFRRGAGYLIGLNGHPITVDLNPR